MSTQSQILANQANAQHSTGPRTETGKATVAANATTHGATSKQALVKGENPDEYQRHVEKFREEFHAVTMHEKFLVQRMADSAWRLHRLQAWEMRLMEQCCRDANPFDDNDQFKKLSRAHRHTQSIERSYHVAHRELVAARKPEKPENEPTKTATPEQTQIPVKPFRFFDNTWNGKINISKKNPVPQHPWPENR
jgi:hypothetical protein